MKKYLLLASAVAIVFTANAQDLSKAVYRDASSHAKIDQEPVNGPAKPITAPNSKAASVVDIGTSYNVYTILGNRQNQVTYNAAINTVGFVHRQNDGSAGGSGIISFDYSTDGGTTWTTNPFQLTPGLGGGNGNRYPNITLYNPAANTNSANAYVVVAGPQLETGTTSIANGWGGTFRSSAKLDGTNLDEQYAHLSTDTVGDNNEWGAAGIYTTPNGNVFYVSTNIDNPANSNALPDQYAKYFINKGVFNAINNNFDWTADTISPNWNTTMNFTSNSPTNVSGLGNMAWSPNGMIGYMVTMGAAGSNTMYRPYVMKTTDGGNSWNNVNDYDFSTNSVMQQYIQPLNTNPALQRPFFSNYDMVVDVNNELRIFAEVNSGFSDHPDSLNFTFSAIETGFLFEVATNGTGWDVTFIDSTYVDDFVWDATNNLSHFVRPQAARSQDGSKVFYTWSSSDPVLSLEREYPVVWGIGHDISGSEPNPWSGFKNFSAGTGAEYNSAYQTIAVDAIENGSDETWELAIVYGTDISGSAISNGLTAPQWHFLKGVGFSPSDFATSGGGDNGGTASGGTIPDYGSTISVEENNLNNNIFAHPNPTNGILSINIDNVDSFTYTIVDVIGNVVATKTVTGNNTIIDLSTNSNGIYFININASNSSITKKIILSK